MRALLQSILRKYKIDEPVSPLFYCLPIGLRFATDEKNAKKRAQAVFRELFEGQVLVVSETEPEASLAALTAHAPHETEARERYDAETGELETYLRHIYTLDGSAEKLADIALRHPNHYRGRLFWMEPQSGVIMTVYDTRGFDVAAPRKEPLAPLYRRRRAWLSEIDLPQMRMIFE